MLYWLPQWESFSHVCIDPCRQRPRVFPTQTSTHPSNYPSVGNCSQVPIKNVCFRGSIIWEINLITVNIFQQKVFHNIELQIIDHAMVCYIAATIIYRTNIDFLDNNDANNLDVGIKDYTNFIHLLVFMVSSAAPVRPSVFVFQKWANIFQHRWVSHSDIVFVLSHTTYFFDAKIKHQLM